MSSILMNERKHLFDDVDKIPLYHKHRRNLRPWDRKLPETVEAEGDRRQRWQLSPPTSGEIFGALFGCLVVFQLIGMLPYAVNAKYCSETWNSINKPKEIYKDYGALLAIWIVTHMCTGLSMWLVWLTEGFEKHQFELLTFAIAVFAELAWLDIVMFTKHLDWALGCWIVSLICTVASQVLMCLNKVPIGAAFLIPYDIVCLVMLVYIGAFMKLHGSTYTWIGQASG